MNDASNVKAALIGAEDVERVIAETQDIARIAAPTFQEAGRGRFVAQRFQESGIPSEMDEMGNVFAHIPGDSAEGDVAVLAHLDTVFPIDTILDIRRVGDRLLGPGIGDNALAVAALLWLGRHMQEERLRRGVLLVAPVGEEGLGDLRGAREVARRDISAGVVIEGHMLGRVITTGIGSRRFRLTFTGPGGHSWEAYGTPNAVHAMMAVGSSLTEIQLPEEPKTTLSIGMVEGGRSVNTIPDCASILLDTRSLSEERLAWLEEEIRLAVQQGSDNTGITVTIERIGQRPAVQIAHDHTLVQLASSALRNIGIEPVLGSASTDANALLAAGIPTVCIGVSRGDNMHRLDEWVSIEPIAFGLRQIADVVRSAGEKR